MPYLDPLNHLQIALLKMHRADPQNETLPHNIQLAINGISTKCATAGERALPLARLPKDDRRAKGGCRRNEDVARRRFQNANAICFQ